MTDLEDAVLVVGGRTTGLMMAAELARHGVPVRIVDASPGIDPHVRANLLHTRTLEIFDTLGLAEAATEGSVAELGYRLYRKGSLVGAVRFAPVDSSYPFGMTQSQAHTEATLDKHLQSFGVRVERSVSLTALEQDDGAVVATLARADGSEERVQTPWLIGCDGAHSTVRHLLRSQFPGTEDPYQYLLADVLVHGELSDDESHIFLHDDGDLYMFTTLPGDRRLISANLPSHVEASTPTLQDMQKLVDERAAQGIRLSDPHWLSHFKIHYRLAPHYRQGRVFLAGDAAHVHSFLGGQGMNTGIQDAHNLAWKLALVMKGIVPESWLDSYELERRGVGAGVIETVRTVTDQFESFAELTSEERDRLVDQLGRPAGDPKESAGHLQELDLDYRKSPLCLVGEPEPLAGGPVVGVRAPDAPTVIDGRASRLFELFGSTRHQLLFFLGEDEAKWVSMLDAARRVVAVEGHWIDVSIVTDSDASIDALAQARWLRDGNGTLLDRYGVGPSRLYLIRPDGYVSFRSANPNGWVEYLARTRLDDASSPPSTGTGR